MGAAKLLLPYRESTLIEQTLAAWKQSAMDAIVVVVRPGDAKLAETCRQAGAEVVVPPQPPPQMRDSVQQALIHLERNYAPREEDVWLLAPADMPNLSPAVVARLLASHRPSEPAILVPTLGGQRGHPVLFPWSAAAEIHALPATKGINVLTQDSGVREVSCDRAGLEMSAFEDVDTPEEYRRLKESVN